MATLYRDNRTFFGIEDETWITLAIWAIIAMDGISYNVNRIFNFYIEKSVIWDSAIFTTLSVIFILLGTASAIKKNGTKRIPAHAVYRNGMVYQLCIE